MKLRYQRALIKLSGEIIGGTQGRSFDRTVLASLAKEVQVVSSLGVCIGLVVGGGNICRGDSEALHGMDRVAADHMGMLATVINAIALQDSLERLGATTRLMTAIEMRSIAEPYIKRRMDRHLKAGHVTIFAAGTGNPYFSTDTAAALRASEMRAEILIKGTKVDGVYDRDPMQHADAQRYERLNYADALSQELKVMDSTAIAFCKDNQIPILVVNVHEPGILHRAMCGMVRGTLVGDIPTQAATS